MTLTLEQREDLQRQVKELDEAMEEVIKARYAIAGPFDQALAALQGQKDTLLERHEVDIAGKCETCGCMILVGEKGYTYADEPGIMFCEEHSPTWASELESAKELIEAADDPSEYQAFLELAQSKVDAGDGDKKNCWVL